MTIPNIPLVTERPVRLKILGPCPVCGEEVFACGCETDGKAVEMASVEVWREAKFLAVASKAALASNRDWIVEARDHLNEALAKL